MRCCLSRSQFVITLLNVSYPSPFQLVPPASSCCDCYRDIKCLIRITQHASGFQSCSRACVDVVDVKWFVVWRPTTRPLCLASHIFTGFSAELSHTLFSLVSTRERVYNVAVRSVTQRGATRSWRVGDLSPSDDSFLSLYKPSHSINPL